MSSTKYSYISNQKVAIKEVDNPVILYSAAHSGLSELSALNRGCTTFHHLPVVCHSFGVLVTLSHQSRGYASLTTCLWSCQPFGLAFFSRASYKEYDSPCSSDWPRTDSTRPLPRAHNTVKFWFIIGLNLVIDFGRFNLMPIDTQSIPDHYPNMTARWDRGWAEARGKWAQFLACKGGR